MSAGTDNGRGDPIPNAVLAHQPDTTVLRARLQAAGWTMAEIAMLAGVSQRTIEHYLSPRAAERGHVIPYPLQFTLEAIACHPRATRAPRRKKAATPAPAPEPASWRAKLRARSTTKA